MGRSTDFTASVFLLVGAVNSSLDALRNCAISHPPQSSQALYVCTYLFFTARSTYASSVLGIVILSVHLSVRQSLTRVLCDETVEHTADILTSHERVIILVHWYQQRLVEDVPFHIKISLKVTHPFGKRRLRQISAYNVYAVTGSENV